MATKKKNNATVIPQAEEVKNAAESPSEAVVSPTDAQPAESRSTDKPKKSGGSSARKKSSAKPAEQVAAEQPVVDDDKQAVSDKPIIDEKPTEAEKPVAEQPVEDKQIVEEKPATEEKAIEEKPAVEAEAQETPLTVGAETKPAFLDNKKSCKADGIDLKKIFDFKSWSDKKKKAAIIGAAAAACVVVLGTVVPVCIVYGGGDKNTYTVTFDTRGGSDIAPYKLNLGDIIHRPAQDPVKAMFKFDDWYWRGVGQNGENRKFKFETPVSGDVTIYAGWIGASSLKFEFDANGGVFAEAPAAMYCETGEKISTPEQVPTRAGYDFDGWYIDADYGNSAQFDFSKKQSASATLYAGWKEKSENVYISYFADGELLRVDYMAKGTTLELPTDLFKNENGDADDNVIVAGFYTKDDYTGSYTPAAVNENLSLHVLYYSAGLTFDNNTVTGYSGDSANIVIPAVYEGRRITTIGVNAFYRSNETGGITSVKLPDTIVTISAGAFYDCRYLTSINISKTVTSIGENAFYRNERLRSIGDISNVAVLGDGAFLGCKLLGKITLSNALNKIGDYAFSGCEALAEIEIPANVISIGANAFSGCKSLKKVVVQSATLGSIGANAFKNCPALEIVSLEKTSAAVTLGAGVFDGDIGTVIHVPSALLEKYKTDNAALKDKFAVKEG